MSPVGFKGGAPIGGSSARMGCECGGACVQERSGARTRCVCVCLCALVYLFVRLTCGRPLLHKGCVWACGCFV